MYNYFGGCPMNVFFLSETLVVGIVLVLASTLGPHSKGLLTPCLLFGFNTYLVFGSITNNPDLNCNQFAVPGNKSERARARTGLSTHGMCVFIK